MISILLIPLAFLGVFLTFKRFRNSDPQQNLPPGPWGLPFLGHLVSLGLNPLLTLMKWKQKYGPIIQIRFGSFPTVILSDSKLVKEAYAMNEFSGRPQLQVFVEANLRKGIVWSDGAYNTEIRQFAIRKLKEFGMGRKTLEGKIQDGISEFMDFIKMIEGLPINSEDVPSAHIIKTLWSILMTEELNPEEIEHLTQLVNGVTELGPVLSEMAGFMPWMEKMVRILTFGHFSLIATRGNHLKPFLSFFAKSLEEKKGNQSETPVDMMDFYLEKLKETTDKSSPFHDSAKYVLGDFFGGGIHTIHTTLNWMFLYMARNPEVQLKLQEEIDQVTGQCENDLSRLPSLLDRGQMPYADAVINELLRISSVVPLALPHNTTNDARFHDYTIKKGTMVFVNTYGIHFDPEIWGDPHNFRPERWFGESGKKLKSEHFLPFSTGRRICPGEALAREQLFLYITTLFQKYSVEFDLGKVPEVKGVFGITLHPSQFTVVFNQRKTHKKYLKA